MSRGFRIFSSFSQKIHPLFDREIRMLSKRRYNAALQAIRLLYRIASAEYTSDNKYTTKYTQAKACMLDYSRDLWYNL